MPDRTDRLYLLKVPEIRDAFLEAVAQITDRAVINEMIKAIEEGDFDKLCEMAGITPAVFDKMLKEIEDTYAQAGEGAVKEWPKVVKTSGGTFIPTFNMRNAAVEKELSDFSSNFITLITAEMRENIRTVLTDGMARGANPRSTALNIVGRIDPTTKKRVGGVIGLSANQTRWVMDVRRYLEQLDESYLNLGLRDKRFDSVVKKAIESGQQLSVEKIVQIVTAYEQKALKYRADMIARTETLQAINRAEAMAVQQALDEGKITKNMVRKWWDDTGDARTRHSHLEMGKKYSKDKAIPIDEPFVFPDGQKCMYPGDTSMGLGPKEIINCRCKVQYDIDFLAEVTGEYRNV